MEPLTFFKCLSEETRLKSILLISEQGELCVCELMTALTESQPKVSRHLAQLRQCGLLQDQRHGQWVYYQLNNDLPDWVLAVLNHTLQADKDFLTDNRQRLEAMHNRPDKDKNCG